MLGRRRAKLVVLTAAAVAGLGGGIAVAAATRTLPTAASDHSHTAATPGARASTTAPAFKDRTPSSTTAPSSSQGPDANGPAKFGLCTAFASGRGTTNGDKADSTAFQALAMAAGGVSNIPGFCADATPGGGRSPIVARSGGEHGMDNQHPNTASSGRPPTPGNSETGRNDRP